MRISALLVLAAFWTSAHAQLNTCVEDGKKVIRQQPCATIEPRRLETPPSDQSSSLDANPATISTPIFSQVVLFKLPAGWKSVHRNSTPTSYLMEFVPKGQTLQAWRDMITVQGFRDLVQNPNATPKNFLASLSSRIEKTCGSQFVVQSLGDSKIDSFDAHSAIVGCANMGRQSEIAYYVAIKGSNDMYLIHRAFRAEPFDKSKPPLSTTNAPALMNSLQPIKICERSEPQAQCWSRKPR